MRKKFMAVALAAALACNMTAAPVAAQPMSVVGMSVLRGLFGGDSSDKEDKKKDAKEETKENTASEDKAGGQESANPSKTSGAKESGAAVLDIGKGDVIIRQKEISAFDVNGNPVTDSRSQYVVTGYSEEHTIQVDSGASADIVLSDVTIIQSAQGESPLWLADDAGNVQVTLQGSNTLQAGPGAAAIQKNCTHNGTDCKCKRLEITCGNTSSGHVCDSECGTLNATGGEGAAAIGGAAGMGCANLNIKGGMITANGGVGGASGAIGTDVTITGGVVEAGSVNGKDKGGNLMGGNTLVFADANVGLERSKGILYENGAGTVYGNVKLSQGMADFLPAGSSLTIPEGSSLTVDEGTVLPNAESVIGEVTVKQDKKRKNSDPVEETMPEAAPVMEQTQMEAQAGDVYGGRINISLLDRAGKEIANPKYGSVIQIQANVIRDNSVSDNKPAGVGESVSFYINRNLNTGQQGGAKQVTFNESGINGIAISDPITLTSTAIRGLSASTTAAPVEFVAVYSGDATHAEITGADSRQLIKGDLLASFAEEGPIAAGQTVEKGLELPSGFLPQNEAGENVNGDWHWQETGRLWPGNSTTYHCAFTPTADADVENYNPFTLERTPTVNIGRISASANENLKLQTEYDNGPTEDGWYNESHGAITASLMGYKFFKKEVGENISTNEWEDPGNWGDNKTIEIGNTGFHNGQHEMYVRNEENQSIGLAYIESLKVDRNLPYMDPVTDKYIEWDIGGSEVYPIISSKQEGRESGLSVIYCAVKPKLDQATPVAELTYNQVMQQGQRYPKNGTEDFTQAMFSFDSLSPRSYYDMYVILRDKAGNEAKYIHRGSDVSGNMLPGATEAAAFPNETDRVKDEFYAYTLRTDYQNFKGTVNMVVTAPDGTVRTDNTVTWGDKITADVDTNMGNYGSRFIYAWYRVPKGSTTRQVIGGEILDYYVPTKADVGCQIICTARGDLTSSHSPAEGEVGPVQRQPAPQEYMPTSCSVNDIQNVFTFNGYNGLTYQYRTDGGRGEPDAWQNITGDGSGRFEIYVGDVTIKAGDLLVRSGETDDYLPGEPVASEFPFISTAEMAVTLTGEDQYGELLTAGVNATSIDFSQISFVWSYSDGTPIDNVGNTYEVRKEDIGKIIQVRAVVPDFPNVENTAKTGRIGKRKVTAVVNVTPKQYDGTTDAEGTVEIKGLVNNDDLVGTAKVEFTSENAGEHKVKVTNARITGNDQEYYSVTWDTDDTMGTILPRQLSQSELEMVAENKVYDGTVDAEVRFTVKNLQDRGVRVSGAGEFDDKNVGKNKLVTAKDIEITGSSADNYTAVGSTITTTADITPKDIELEGITVADKEYDATTDAVIQANFKGAVDDVSYTYKAAFENPNVGKDKRVTATITLTGDSAKNYNLANGDITGTGNIVKALAPYEESNIPKDLTGIEGKKLSSVYIGSGFKWKTPSTVMETVGRHNYPAYYNPDPSQYGDREVELEVLVQCAKHTWGEWSITVEPTKEEMGERQRICSVCGYTEVETIARAPYIANDDTKVGWGDIIQAINNASSGTEIPVVMNGTETLPASVLETLQGREVSLVLQMGDGITWTIRGEDITASALKDINMALTMYTDNIPSDVIDPYVKGKTAIQLHLAYSGEFGFVATLRVPFADEFAGVNSTLYYYNPNRGRLEQMDKNRITDDGIGRYDFNHASDYVVIIDKASDTQGGDTTPSGNNTNVTPIAPTATVNPGGAAGQQGNATGGAARTTSANNARFISSNGAKTSDNTPIAAYVALLALGAAGIASFGYYKRKKK